MGVEEVLILVESKGIYPLFGDLKKSLFFFRQKGLDICSTKIPIQKDKIITILSKLILNNLIISSFMCPFNNIKIKRS